MNALQRRRFARGMYVVENADVVDGPSGLVWLHAVMLPDGGDLEYFLPEDAARLADECDKAVSWGNAWERALWRGQARALRRWLKAQTQASGSTSPTQADDTCHTRSG